VILETVDRVRALRPDAIYCLDPVMGDSDKGFFVRPGIPELIRDEALPRATIVKPNQFEAEFLSGMKIASVEDARRAGEAIRARGPKIALITSFMAAPATEKISMYLSTDSGDWIITTDKIPLRPEPNGGGDLSSALFLGRYLQSGGDARLALEQTANSVYAVYERTREAGTRELALVASRFDIMNAPCRYRSERA
jgi:pyridoxine kinase